VLERRFFGGGKENGWETVGVEPSDKARAIEKKQFHLWRILRDWKSFLTWLLWHVLEHPNLDNQIKELKRLLKPSGTLIVAVPNFKSFDAKHYGTFWRFMMCRFTFGTFQKIKCFLKRRHAIRKKVLHEIWLFLCEPVIWKSTNTEKWISKFFFVGLQSNVKAKQNSEYSSIFMF
jgi:predicted SAM-dependent methyltransferase